MKLFELFGTIAIDHSEASRGLDTISTKAGGLTGVLEKVGSAAVAAGKVIATGLAAGTAAVGALTKTAVQEYAEYEQLVGGVETLFGDSAGKVQEYAANAYKTAGLSANDYMETVTSFSASLLQSLGGDTAAAAEYADQAIIDMADNANKMGTSMASIQNAYQGFAKQNYSMLDNLKLGYGGTQSEMFRLLQDAAALNETFAATAEFSLDEKGHLEADFADIVQAIHIIQTEMKISGLKAEEAAELVERGVMTEEEAFEALGTTAKEASTTIQGSLSSAKSAWTNMLVGMANENADFNLLIDQFVDSVGVAAQNIIPRVEIALSGAAQLVERIVPVIVDRIPAIINNVLPQILASAVAIVQNLVDGISSNKEIIMQTVLMVGTVILQTIIDLLPDVVALGVDLLLSLANGILENLDTLIGSAVAMLGKIIETVTDPNTLETLLTAAVAILVALAGGLVEFLPKLVDAAIGMVQKIVEVVTQSDVLDKLLTAAVAIIAALAGGLVELLPKLVDASIGVVRKIVEVLTQDDVLDKLLDATLAIIMALAEGLVEFLPELINAAATIIIKLIEYLLDQENMNKMAKAAGTMMVTLAEGLINSVWRLVKAGGEIGKSFIESLTTINWNEVGGKIISGIGDGLKKAWDNFVSNNSWVSDILGTVGSVFSSGSNNKRSGTFGLDGSHADGLDYVPYDGYVAELHKGEMVVPAAQSQMLRAGFGGSEEVLYLLEKIADYLPQLLEAAGHDIVTDDGTILARYAPKMNAELGRISAKKERGR